MIKTKKTSIPEAGILVKILQAQLSFLIVCKLKTMTICFNRILLLKNQIYEN